MSEQIIITDPIIVSYYKENSHIDIITMNHIFIDILKSLSSNLTSTINSTMNSKILNIVTELNSNINTMKLDFMMKLLESKKEYIDDIKNILNSNTLTNNEKISSLIEKNNDNLLSKTTLMINEIIPKTQDKNFSQIETCIKNYCNNITNDTQKILAINSKDENNSKTIIENIETQLNKMITSIQQPIFTTINSSEDRTSNMLNQLKENLSQQNNTQNKLSNDINEFLGKYKNNSQFKGSIAETDLYYMLQTIMPSDEIIKVSGNTANCDFKVNRQNKNKPSILFESKDYSQSVPTDEITKFERDIQIQKTHGIMVSQRSPITYKNSYQIDIINGLIHVYIPNTDYNTDKVKIAIDIIDNLDMKLTMLENKKDNNFIPISKDEIEEIVEEYRLFGIQKGQMLDTIKSINKQLVDKLDEIQLPKIKNLLMKNGNIENDNGFKCELCNAWSGKNKASLAAHIRNCKFNPKNNENISNINSEAIIVNTPIQSTSLVLDISSELTKSSKKIKNK
jgi:hypothetical protein